MVRRSLALVLALALCLSGCSVVVAGTPTSGIPQVATDSTLAIQGASSTSDFDRLARNDLSDIEQFWEQSFPLVSNGKSFSNLSGDIYSVDDEDPDPSADQNACLGEAGVDIVKDNAFYCSLDDSIAYDRRGVIADLAKQYGDYFVGAMFAHEFGHAIQHRLGESSKLPSIVRETQADCASGAFTAWVMNFKAPHIRVTPAALDKVLVGYIQLRDPEPQSSTVRGSHGNGFDRVGAFQTGITGGVRACYASSWSDRQFTERGYSSESDSNQSGDQTMDEVLNATSSGGGLEPDMNAYWTKAAATVGKTWTNVSLAQADHPPCQVNSTVAFGYCPASNTVYYSDAIAQTAYRSGDFSLGTLLAFGWGLAVRAKLFGREIASTDALLAASCYTGAYASSVNDPDKSGFGLSPSDMDEATTSVLSVVSRDDVLGGRGTTGLTRITSFNKGYFGGLSAC